MRNGVTCANDYAMVNSLKQGRVPIHEPGPDDLVASDLREGRLRFTISFAEAVANSSVYFIAVGTPPKEDGLADLRHLLEVARDPGRLISGHCTVVDKSTVPVGTADTVNAIRAELVRRGVRVDFDVVSNPEFARRAMRSTTSPPGYRQHRCAGK